MQKYHGRCGVSGGGLQNVDNADILLAHQRTIHGETDVKQVTVGLQTSQAGSAS